MRRETVSTQLYRCLYIGRVREATCEKRLLAPPCLSVRLAAWNYSTTIGLIFVKLNIFTKIRGHVLIFVQIGKNNRHFNEKLPTSMRLAFIAEKRRSSR